VISTRRSARARRTEVKASGKLDVEVLDRDPPVRESSQIDKPVRDTPLAAAVER